MTALDKQQRLALPPRKVVVRKPPYNREATCPCCEKQFGTIEFLHGWHFCPWCGERIEMNYSEIKHG